MNKNLIKVYYAILIIAICVIANIVAFYDIKKQLNNIETEIANTQPHVYYYTPQIASDSGINLEIKQQNDIVGIAKDKYNFKNIQIEPVIATNNISSEGLYNNNQTGYSDSAFIAMCRVVEAETHGCDIESKKHIASVILNRVKSNDFPNTIENVCYQSGQFASRGDIEQSTVDAVNSAVSEGDTTNNALYFCTCSGCWADVNKEYIFTDSAGHNFYK